jgi:hypothetical protein
VVNGKPTRLAAPPRPGVTASRRGQRVVVNYSFRPFPRECRPATIEVVIDVTDDTLAGNATQARISSRTGTLSLVLPPLLAKADTVRATAVSERGVPGEAVSIRLKSD